MLRARTIAGRSAASAVVLLCTLSLTSSAQETKAQFEVGAQSYFQGNSSSDRTGIVGGYTRFREYIEGVGILRGSVEGYASNGNFRSGETYLELGKVPWMSRQWSFRVGDFQQSFFLDNLPFGNLITPTPYFRGVEVKAETADTLYSAMVGFENLLEGPRIPFRRRVAQNGAMFRMERRISERWRMNARAGHLWSSQQGMEEQYYFFPYMRELTSTTSGAAQLEFRPDTSTRIFGEASVATANWLRPGDRQNRPFGGIAGYSRETNRLTVRANYVYQPANYLPLAGYYLGDRAGPSAEFRARPWQRLEVFSAGGVYRNNLERNPEVRDLRSWSTYHGATLQVTKRVNWDAQYSLASIRAQGGDLAAPQDWNNRMLSTSVSMGFRNHNLRLTYRDINLYGWLGNERRVSKEVEDFFSIGSFSFNAGARFIESQAVNSRNTVFFRGGMHWMHRNFTAYANVEAGNDLVNKTLFATQSISTTVFGASVRVTKDWKLNVEGFRNRYAMNLNQESLFVLQNQGVGFAPLLGSNNQWNLFVRMHRQFNFGPAIPGLGGPNAGFPRELAATGSLEGFVYELRSDAKLPAAGVPVGLDGSRKTMSDEKGRYRFSDVPEGLHRVVLGADALPPEFEPEGEAAVNTSIRATKVSRNDFLVKRLCTLQGRVKSDGVLDSAGFESIVIRLVPGKRYTTPSADGTFAFYNLPAGKYELVFDGEKLPENAALVSPERIGIEADGTTADLVFEVENADGRKPVRKVLEKRGVSPAGKAKETKAKPRAGASGQSGTCGEWRNGKVVVKPCAEMGAAPEDWLSGKAKAKASGAANRGGKARGKQVVRRGNAKRPAKQA
jgi:hypothetical protein